jgi:two-component system cell cycle sensor histidine kinase/response regulator CckA
MARDARHATILVADDNPDILGHVRALLEISGYAVITASNGEEALCIYERHQSQISLLLTDVAMPNINGFDLADRVLCVNPQLPVVFMSGSSGSACRGLEWIPKPFRPAELVEKVSRTLQVNAASKEQGAR